ncbi:hypothetical protein N9444_05890 [Gammaproteobacteria bacterium]|nr:hypothetical protein [Gammaproteobacteria bacterium]
MKRFLIHHYLIEVFHPLVQLTLIVGFLFIGLSFRFEIPRFDYWDIVFESTFVLQGEGLLMTRILEYLFSPVADQIMVLPKLTIFLTNHLAGYYFLELEIILSWLLLVIGYLMLLSIYSIPLTSWSNLKTDHKVKTVVCFAVYWWLVTLPSITNNWFAIQYGIVLVTGIAAIYCFDRAKSASLNLVYGYVWFCLCALSHGTGILLGPALAVWLYFRSSCPKLVIILILGTSLILVWLVWSKTQPSGVIDHSIVWSTTSLKYFMRVGTPYYWEQVIFIVVVLPAFVLTSWVFINNPSIEWRRVNTILIVWGLGVWVVTFYARHEFQATANPHYVRFFVLLYLAGFMSLSTMKIWKGQKQIVIAISILMICIWAKGIDKGLYFTKGFLEENIRGYHSLLNDVGVENLETSKIYPLSQSRLTMILIPRLVNYEPYGYRLLFRR